MSWFRRNNNNIKPDYTALAAPNVRLDPAHSARCGDGTSSPETSSGTSVSRSSRTDGGGKGGGGKGGAGGSGQAVGYDL